jgi:hypothetical protein
MKSVGYDDKSVGMIKDLGAVLTLSIILAFFLWAARVSIEDVTAAETTAEAPLPQESKSVNVNLLGRFQVAGSQSIIVRIDTITGEAWYLSGVMDKSWTKIK